jgi:thioredoxin 1
MAYTRDPVATEPAREEIDASPGRLLLEFGTPWCGHCIAAQPALEAELAGRGDIRHLKVEDGRGRPLGRSFRVKLWPTLVALQDGQEVGRLVRPTRRDEVAQLLASLDGAPPTAIEAG